MKSLSLRSLFNFRRPLTLALLVAAVRFASVYGQGAAEPGNTLHQDETPAPAESPMNETAAASDEALQFQQFHLFDPMVNNEALRVLVPNGWKAKGGIAWRHNASNLAVCNLSLSDPSGQRAFSFYPCDAMCYAANLQQYGFAIGSNYLGGEVCYPIQNVADYVTQIVLPRYRDRSLQFRVVGVEELRTVADAVVQASAEPGMQKQATAARVRVEYELGGRTIEEDIYCTLTFATGEALPGFIQWGPERIYSFAAPKGELDASTPMFQAMANSMTLDMGWFNKHRQVYELWAQRMQQSIRDAGMLSRYIAQINDEITQINREAYEYQQRAMDRVNRQFSNYIRGVEEYTSPYSNYPVQLPAGYTHVWANSLGGYQLSNSASFNPNQNSSVQWVQLTRVG